MTGTASELCEYNENETSDFIKAEFISAWLFGRINANCTLYDISHCGCAILLPTDQKPPLEVIKLIIMSPDDDEKIHTILAAEPRWIEEDYSSLHKKMGFRFLEVKADLYDEISSLIPHVKTIGSQSLKCSILNKSK